MNDYNGWKNWETWNAFTWLSNDEGTQRRCESLDRELELGDAAQALRDMLTEPVDDMGPSWHTDVLLHALSAVDWIELAMGFRD